MRSFPSPAGWLTERHSLVRLIAESRQRFPGGFSRPGNCRLDPVQRVSVAIWARTAPDMTSAEKALAYRARPARSSLVISSTLAFLRSCAAPHSMIIKALDHKPEL